MRAYLFGKLVVQNWDWYKQYRSVAEPLVAKHGGTYLVKGGASEILEGEAPAPDAFVLIEFPSIVEARSFYADPDYAPMIELRRTSGVTCELAIIEGIPPRA